MSGNHRRNGHHKPYIPPPPETLTWNADGLDVSLSIARANGSIGTYRVLLLQRAKEEEAGNEGSTADLLTLANTISHLYVYPSLIAAVVKAEGFHQWPISFEEYLTLPEPFLMAWEAKVFELNPHWKPKEPEQGDPVLDEELQKKVETSAQGS